MEYKLACVKRRIRGFVAAITLAIALPARAEPHIGEAAPALGLEVAVPPGVAGRVELVRGKINIVDFATTWCEPCHRALGKLVPFVATLDPSQVSLVVVDVQEPVERVREVFGGLPLPPSARVALDPDAAASTRWGRRRFPTTFVVDREGVIRFIHIGCGPGYGDRVAGWVRSLLPVAPKRASE